MARLAVERAVSRRVGDADASRDDGLEPPFLLD